MAAGDRSSAPVSLAVDDDWEEFESKVERRRGPAAHSAFMPAPGVLIASKYRLTRPIGEGGMGAVWAAEHVALGHEVAVKFLLPSAASDPRVAMRFEAEARMAAAIKHRCVVDVFDFGTTHGVPFMVLELLEGEELGARIQSGPALSVKDAIRLMAQCLNGLEAVHRAGIVHRDLKPENIFLVREHDAIFPKLLDFGIARMNEAGAPARKDSSGVRRRRLTEAGIAIGTPSYMSPEQLRADHELDGRADLYSMGVILFELLTGRVPFTSENVADLLVDIMTRDTPRLRDLRPELGRGLSDVLARAMARERARRFSSVAELREALERLLPDLPDAACVLQDGRQLQAGAIGAHTEQLLQAARDPFAGEREGPLFRRTRVRLTAALGLGLVCAMLGWVASRNASRDAKATLAAPHASTQTLVHTPSASPAAETAVKNSDTNAYTIGSAAVKGPKTGSDSPPKIANAAGKTSPKHGSHRVKSAKAAPQKAAKKLFRNLDF